MPLEIDPRLAQALRAAEASPAEESLWDELEELAHEAQRPDEVAALYREILGRPLEKGVAERIGRRAVAFHEEWFADDTKQLTEVLRRVLVLDPASDWALSRATMLLTASGDWASLLGLYDDALGKVSEPWRRGQLLSQASQLAKDFAGAPDRAIDYQKQLLALRPNDTQLASSLERLLERQGRWLELIELWRRRVAAGDADATGLRERIATTLLDPIGDAAATLIEARALLESSSSHAHATALLERLLARDSASAEVRRGALALLRDRYESLERGSDIERILAIALDFASPHERIAIHRELAERALARGDDAAAIGQYSSLLHADPAADDAEQQLRALAGRTGAHDRHADALVAAATAATDAARRAHLFLEAGDVQSIALRSGDRAEPLYRRVLEAEEAGQIARRTAARRLVGLLDRPDRASDKLLVLEQLASLDDEPAERRRVLGQAARLAEQLGDADRALALWQLRLGADTQDLEAIDARIGILERESRWQALIDALALRAQLPVPPPLKRADLVRIAGTYEQELEKRDAAITTWLEVQENFGEDVESVDALFRLFTDTSRWEELAAMLDRAVRRDQARAADIVVRLADVQRERLADPTRAATGYHHALKLDPGHEGARAGLRVLVAHASAKASALDGLAEAAQRTGDHAALLALLEERLLTASSDRVRVRLLKEAADLEEHKQGDKAAAFRAIRRAFVLQPDDETLENELLRLGAESTSWADTVSALQEATGLLLNDPRHVAALHRRAALISERELDDARSALTEHLAAFALEPHELDGSHQAVRIAASLGDWPNVASVLVRSVLALRRIDESLLERIENAAEAALAWEALAASVAAAMQNVWATSHAVGPRLAELGRSVETRIAVWERDRRGDLARAEAAFARALSHDGGHAETLGELARLQWREPSRALVDTLLAIGERAIDDVDALYDAARIALDPVGDVGLAKNILQRLLREATRLWERGTPIRGEHPADRTALWALEELVRIHLEQDKVAEAMDLLSQGSRLPVAATEARALRRRAGELAKERLGDEGRAMRLYQSIADESLEDAVVVDRLAAMYEARTRIPELLALRQRELHEKLSAERRLAVRLDVARMLGRLESGGERIEMLRANLSETPGHDASISEIAVVLAAKGSHLELADLLTREAQKVEASDPLHAAKIWAMVAGLADAPLADPERAIAAHRRVVSLAPTAEAYDALARLYSAKADHARAAEWLEKRLDLAKGALRTPIAQRLAEARLGEGRVDRAVNALERAIAEDPTARTARERLADLYRRTETWGPLARLLSEGASHVDDASAQLAYLREASDILRRRLGQPERAIPNLERAMRLAPEDAELRAALGEGLRVAGRLDEARALFEKLVAEFGRRRTPERAALHFQLAQVARASGDLNEALSQLDKASGIDLGHAGILRMLGDLSREAGQLDRAERAYRSLLLLVRRQVGEGKEPAVGIAEVLYELSHLATELGQKAQAGELLESAFESAAQSGLEASRFTRTLVARGMSELALRAIEMRLHAETSADGRANALADRAELLETVLDRPGEALDARLEVLELMPSRAAAESARALAIRTGRLDALVPRIEAQIERMRRKEDAKVVSDLLLVVGDIAERDRRDLDEATRLYRKVEELGERPVDAWRALARIASSRSDHVEEIRVLRRLIAAGVDTQELGGTGGIPEEAKTEAFYRIAEVELGDAATLESGLSTLSDALLREPDNARAARILHDAARRFPRHESLLALYERAARGSGDPALQLDMLEVVASTDAASVETVREAIEVAQGIATRAGGVASGPRVEALLERGVALASGGVDGLAAHLWLPNALADARLGAGDVAGALRWREAAAGAAEQTGDSERARELWRGVAELAQRPEGDPAHAARVIRRLLESDPTDRSLWAPLAEAHARLQDRAGYEASIRAIVDASLDATVRNDLRMELANYLLDVVRDEREGVSILTSVLDDDPDHLGAAQRLADLYEQGGRAEQLAEMLARQLDRARDRQDVTAIAALSLRAGGLLEASRPDDARELYRQGLEWAPADPKLLRALLALHREDDGLHEKVGLAERLLSVENGEAASRLAVDLADSYALLEDGAGVGRALELGFRANPQDHDLLTRLESWYRGRGELAALADVIAFDAAHRSEPQAALARYREAAALYGNELERPEAAVEVLEYARSIAPADVDVLRDLVNALVGSGRIDDAARAVGHAIERDGAPSEGLAKLLRMRARLRGEANDREGATQDLETSYGIDPAGSYQDLAALLERRRGEGSDKETERALMLRLSTLLREHGEVARGREVLADWSYREPGDREVLRLLRLLDTVSERWAEVLRHCTRLVEVEEGDAQVEAALALADAAQRLERPDEARLGLERAFREQPTEPRLRDALRGLYESTRAYGELATILIADAQATDQADVRFDALKRAGEMLVYEVQDPVRAIDPLRDALALKRDDADVTVVLSDAYIGAGALAEAVELLQVAINGTKRRRSPALAMMQLRMARIASLSGDHATQLEWLKVALESDKANGAIAAELADLAIALGDDNSAMNALKVVTLQKTPGPMSRAVAFLRQAQIAHRSGDHQKAVLWARRARIEDAELREAEDFLTSIGES